MISCFLLYCTENRLLKMLFSDFRSLSSMLIRYFDFMCHSEQQFTSPPPRLSIPGFFQETETMEMCQGILTDRGCVSPLGCHTGFPTDRRCKVITSRGGIPPPRRVLGAPTRGFSRCRFFVGPRTPHPHMNGGRSLMEGGSEVIYLHIIN